MNFSEIFQLSCRHKFTIILIILVCGLAGFLVGTRYSTEHFNNSIFIDLSIQDKYQHTSTFENLEAADQITESIQGWLKDPSFQAAVTSTTQPSFAIQSKRQEKNNLIITFTSPDTQSANSFSGLIIAELQHRIDQYNQNSDLNIFANSQPLQSQNKPDQKLLYIVLGLIVGALLSLPFAWLYEKLTGKLSSKNEFTNITGIKKPFYFHSDKHLKGNHQYLLKYLNQQTSIQILNLIPGHEINLEPLFKHISKIITLAPEDIESANLTTPTILLTQLGRTNTLELERISQLKFSSLEGIIFDRFES